MYRESRELLDDLKLRTLSMVSEPGLLTPFNWGAPPRSRESCRV